jgi:hypothetical protein
MVDAFDANRLSAHDIGLHGHLRVIAKVRKFFLHD